MPVSPLTGRPPHGVDTAPTMEFDQILALLMDNPPWLTAFPVTCAVEYFVEPSAQHAGRGDLVMCNEAYNHFMVVEVKRSKHATPKLLAQMLHYRDHLKWKLPGVRVDCAAVRDGELIAIRHDTPGGDVFFTDHFQRASMGTLLVPTTLPFNRMHKAVQANRRVRLSYRRLVDQRAERRGDGCAVETPVRIELLRP